MIPTRPSWHRDVTRTWVEKIPERPPLPGESTLQRLARRKSRRIQKQSSVDRLSRQITLCEKFDSELKSIRKQYRQRHNAGTHQTLSIRRESTKYYPKSKYVAVPYSPREPIKDTIRRLFPSRSASFDSVFQHSSCSARYSMSREPLPSVAPSRPSMASNQSGASDDTIVVFSRPFSTHISHQHQILNAIKMDDVKLLHHIVSLCNLICNIQSTYKLVNTKDEFHCPLLVTAAQYGRTEICRELINYGHKIHCKNHEGWTPMLTAAFFGHFETMKLLMDSAQKEKHFSIYNFVTLNDLKSLKTKWNSPHLLQHNEKNFVDYVLEFWSKVLIVTVSKESNIDNLQLIDHILKYNGSRCDICRFKLDRKQELLGIGGKRVRSDCYGNTVIHYVARTNNTDVWNLMIRIITNGANAQNKPWLLDEYLDDYKNGMGLSVIGYAIYCQSDNILRVIANQMERKMDFHEWGKIEWEWKRRNIDNFITKQSNKPLNAKEKVIQYLVRKIVIKRTVLTDSDIDAQVYRELNIEQNVKARSSIQFHERPTRLLNAEMERQRRGPPVVRRMQTMGVPSASDSSKPSTRGSGGSKSSSRSKAEVMHSLVTVPRAMKNVRSPRPSKLPPPKSRQVTQVKLESKLSRSFIK